MKRTPSESASARMSRAVAPVVRACWLARRLDAEWFAGRAHLDDGFADDAANAESANAAEG